MLLELKNIVKRFPVKRGFFGGGRDFVHALSDVSLFIKEGETLGLVGESGCGKSTLGRIAVGLYKPDSGTVVFGGSSKERQIVFQDPYSSLNPRMCVGNIVTEPLIINKLIKKNERFKKAGELLKEAGLNEEFAQRYPHEFSGGQRQRICIARAISTRPRLIVADEPVSSLDVAVQADILELLKDLQARYKMAYLFISHDLRVISKLCSRVAVMYLGKIVELMDAKFIKEPLHPYTEALLSAVPLPDPKIKKKRIILEGDVPSPIDLPKGCAFNPRCRYKEDVCMKDAPVLESKADKRQAACYFTQKVRNIL
ncbi:MAG: peptide ABC transporter ATP-binding protein [Deltaproteobacteria bacterium CG11_big_fil_rev_8_21_14_0_20_49_13]|nr:MAG: peptide ABC transporter ATP-binding protein [Deltaproteobacteria bacterium CG11_big_fil_rev_8_21_14_0_20_49_13]